MITLSFIGLLSVLLAITLVLLIVIILVKEPLETTDTLDRVLLVLFAVCFAVSLAYSGVLVMAGAANGIALGELTTSVIITNSLKIIAILAGWIKIIRNAIHFRR